MALSADDSPRFFVLKNDFGSRYDTRYDSVDPTHLGEPARCTACGEALGMLPWLPPYRADLELHGAEPGDMAEGPGLELLVSERFADAFQAEGLTGLGTFHSVQVRRVRRMRGRGPKPTTVPRYFVVSPCFGRAAVDATLNRIRISAPITCMECRSTGVDAIHGFVLEPGTWQGEDVFRPRGLEGCIVTSQRFADFVERYKLTNMVLTPTERFTRDPSNLGPAPLPQA